MADLLCGPNAPLTKAFPMAGWRTIPVNRLFGDVVKVTPSSKCVGDMSLYLINRKMTAAEVLTDGDNVEFPASA